VRPCGRECFILGNFKKDATVRTSYGRYSAYKLWTPPRPSSVRPSVVIIRVTTLPQCSLDSTKSSAIPMLIGFNQVTSHPNAHWIQPSHRPIGVVPLPCTHLQCNLHFSDYILAMQSMVSTFIRHPSK
jgi:hypothetical protein